MKDFTIMEIIGIDESQNKQDNNTWSKNDIFLYDYGSLRETSYNLSQTKKEHSIYSSSNELLSFCPTSSFGWPHPFIHIPYHSKMNFSETVAPAVSCFDNSLLLQRFYKPCRMRTTYSYDQLDTLESVFFKRPYIVGEERRILAEKLRLSETQIKVWFQNRRTKLRRLKEEDCENMDHLLKTKKKVLSEQSKCLV